MPIRLRQIQYEIISKALAGEKECGDQCFVKELPDSTLLAVVDGLGHGEEAAFAAKEAIEILDKHANEDIATLFKHCNQGINHTRGAAMTVVKIDNEHKLTYLAVGNVMGVCWKFENGKFKKESILLEGGIVGARIPSLLETREIAMSAGDTFILGTDGIKVQFENEPPKLATPDKIAEHIFCTYRNEKDDGLILVAQLL